MRLDQYRRCLIKVNEVSISFSPLVSVALEEAGTVPVPGSHQERRVRQIRVENLSLKAMMLKHSMSDFYKREIHFALDPSWER